MFRLWGQNLPPEIDMCAVQLPGRANRLHEPALDRIEALVDGVAQALHGQLDLPYAFFGHSMGAVLAAETMRALALRGEPPPVHLFVSGRRPSHVPDPNSPLAHLDDTAFVTEINRRYGGIPPELLAHADVMELLLPSLRADIRALERFDVRRGARLDCPITALGGADDLLAPLEHLQAWRDDTSHAFRVRQYPGDHFYLDARRAEVLAEISRTMDACLAAAVDAGRAG